MHDISHGFRQPITFVINTKQLCDVQPVPTYITVITLYWDPQQWGYE